MTFIKWHEEILDRLVELIGQKYSAGMITDIFNGDYSQHFTRNAVIGKARRMGYGFHHGNRTSDTDGKIIGLGGPKRIKKPPPPPKPASRFVRSFKHTATEPTLTIVENLDPSLHVKLLDLEPHHCRWPVEDRLYCGAPRIARGHSYCSIHAVVARRKEDL